MSKSDSDIKKRLDSYLLLIDYFIDNSQKINYDGSDDWKLGLILELSYDVIVKSIKNDEDIKNYSVKSLNLVNKFLEINKMTPSEYYQKRIDHLHQMAEI